MQQTSLLYVRMYKMFILFHLWIEYKLIGDQGREIDMGNIYTIHTQPLQIYGVPSNNFPLIDGPSSISNAPAYPNKIRKLPSKEQLMYYNYYSAAAYYMHVDVDLTCGGLYAKFTCDTDEHRVLTNNIHETLAFISLSKKRKEIVVSFRGTVNFSNTLLVWLVKSQPVSGMEKYKIHRGFYIATMSLFDKLVEIVSELLEKNTGCTNKKFKVVLTGHSLGGAMARITYFFFEKRNQFSVVCPDLVYELYTYGEPRVGNKEFADFMNSQPISTARVVNRADIICHMPSTSFMFNLFGDNFIHPLPEYWIEDENKQGYCNQAVYEDPKCSKSQWRKYNIESHFVYFDTDIRHEPCSAREGVF